MKKYGGNNTVHDTDYLDVEVDENGEVVAVWFRCMPLPFKQTPAGKERAADMRTIYKGNSNQLKIEAIEYRE